MKANRRANYFFIENSLRQKEDKKKNFADCFFWMCITLQNMSIDKAVEVIYAGF